MERMMDKDFTDIPLAQSNVSLKLADIQKRCSQLLVEPDDLIGLSLEDEAPVVEPDNNNPYNQG